ncbi:MULTISPECIES: hypothetical protein [unclassified Amycolatopsis]|uniref:hypothetical protein n=1 Tax=unclassified Amycolatopsis TaxID=2618356 RepID=UPI0028745D19|nr:MULTISPECIES: hypothetical protein [unclassified Amycolatopsis]MDS0135438.1 hypothetical protein [Amycolatopsis sp. 505]MDS0140871.1 hypothetical protein [Amycolatopsis sp. CM201R]
MNRRKALSLVTVPLALAGLVFAPGPAASATVLACNDHFHTINGADPNGHWPPYGEAVTTSYCYDINVKMTETVSVSTCFLPSSGGISCNSRRTVYANTWGLAATDVKDGTHFYLSFSKEGVYGRASY